MKYLFFWILALVATIASSQQIDSMAIKQVDSLIQVSKSLSEEQDYEGALEVNAVAEQLALEHFGRESAPYATCASSRGNLNQAKGDFQEAEKWYIETKAIQEKTLGREHPDYASSLNSLGEVYFSMGQYEKAEPPLIEVLAIREKAFGKEHPDYASSLNSLGEVYFSMGQYEKAEPLFIEAKAIQEKTLGREHPDYAYSLYSLAVLYSNMGQYEKAEPLYIEGQAILEKTLGREHPDYAYSLYSLAVLYANMGHYDKAEPLFIEAKAIQEKTLGREHPDYAYSLNNLGVLYLGMGQYEKAEPLYIEGQAILEKALGREHPDYAYSLGSLAILYSKMGQYEKAELLYIEAKAINEKTLGREHPNYAYSLNSLGGLYMSLGQYDKAEPLLIESQAILGKTLGREYPDYAYSLNSLGVLYMSLGQYDKAEPLYIETKAIWEKTLGREHPDYAHSLNNLAVLYVNMGQYEKAETLYIEAKAIWEKTLGGEHPDYAHSLNSLGDLYSRLGQYEKAEPLFIEAKAIREKALGREHPDYTKTLNSLSAIYETQFRFSDAEPLMQEALTNTKSRLVQATSFLSERELAKYLVTFQDSGDKLNSYLFRRETNGTKHGMLPHLAYDHALFYKGFLLTSASRLNATAQGSAESTEILLRLKGYRRRLAAEYAKPIADRKGIEELEEKANTAEKELARTVSGYAEAIRQVQWQDVRSALSPEAIAVEFVHFRVNFPARTDSVMYAALVLRSGAEDPQFIPLFEEREFEHLLDANKERKADYVNELYAWADRGMVVLKEAKRSLYELIWAKIEATGLEGIQTVYYSPSGVLHRLNLGAMAADDESILSERYNLVALNSTRQLVVPASTATAANDALLVGGVNFEAGPPISGIDDQPILASRSAAEAWKESGNRGGTWTYLKWTQKEVERIASSLVTAGFDAVALTDSLASEEAIKSLGMNGPSPRVLHIATHGFFFPDPQSKSQQSGSGDAEPAFKWSDNSMIRSGLILAGGNYAWQQGQATSPEKEDGILTAYEISQMNLSNTELVVLSACETGLGDIQGNEGVYGLQRAFKIAGAKYLIMSLWQVPDRETMEFMSAFYKNWLEGNMTIPDAFRTTQRQMRDRFFNPYSWAGFVLVE